MPVPVGVAEWLDTQPEEPDYFPSTPDSPVMMHLGGAEKVIGAKFAYGIKNLDGVVAAAIRMKHASYIGFRLVRTLEPSTAKNQEE